MSGRRRAANRAEWFALIDKPSTSDILTYRVSGIGRVAGDASGVRVGHLLQLRSRYLRQIGSGDGFFGFGGLLNRTFSAARSKTWRFR
jgi:hypothetical protein